MNVPVRNAPTVLLIEDHPVRNRLYSERIRMAGYELVRASAHTVLDVRRLYSMAVVSIPDTAAYDRYALLLGALPEGVPCVVLTPGQFPPLLSGHARLVGHVNRAETRPDDLLRILQRVVTV